jgi:hypothetical protein
MKLKLRSPRRRPTYDLQANRVRASSVASLGKFENRSCDDLIQIPIFCWGPFWVSHSSRCIRTKKEPPPATKAPLNLYIFITQKKFAITHIG